VAGVRLVIRRCSQVIDPVLLPMIEAGDEESRGEALERLLLSRAQPVIETVIARFGRSDRVFRRDEVDDIQATATLRLVRRLQSIGQEEDVRDFDNYVATLTYNAIYDFMRRRFPERTRLKNRIRYLLSHDPRFAMWETPETIACGLASWRGKLDVLTSPAITRETASSAMLDQSRPHDAIAAIFKQHDRPLSLDGLVALVAELWGIVESQLQATDESLFDRLPSHAARHETRQFLQVLWNEIKLLPPQHRAALLLNLRDAEGLNAVALFALVGVAELDEIAAALNMSIEGLESIWHSLPLDDLVIAERLHLTRQQVINLRRTARERLARGTFLWKKYERRRG